MPEIVCVKCGKAHNVVHQGYVWGSSRTSNGSIRGVLTCFANLDDGLRRERPCNGETLFELTHNAINWAPGKLFDKPMTKSVNKEASEDFEEAVLCFHGASFRGTVGMCRSAVEDALDAHGSEGRNLDEKIQDAKERLKILGDTELAQSHGARLTGRNALHRGMAVTQTEGLLALQTTHSLINFIGGQTPAA